MVGVTVVSGVVDPGDVTIIPGVSITSSGVTLVSLSSGPSYAYFMSVADTGYYAANVSLAVDSAGKATIFGETDNGGFALQFNSTGLVSASKEILSSTICTYFGVKDSSSNYYAFGSSYAYPTYNFFNIEIYKFDSGLSVISSESLNTPNYVAIQDPVIDSSGYIWGLAYNYDTGAEFKLLKINQSLTPQAYYDAYNGTYYYSAQIAATSTGNLIAAGTFGVGSGSTTGIFVTSVSASNPSGTPNWGQTFAYGSVGNLNSISNPAVDSSNNVYVIGVRNFISAVLFKFNSSGTLLWQTEFNVNAIPSSMVFDSSGNVYVIIFSLSGTGITIIKLNSSGTVQFIRTLTAGSASIYNPKAKIANDQLYISFYIIDTGLYYPSVIKLPIDGSLTQTFSVAGFTVTYAAGSLTQTTSTYTVTPNSTFNFTALTTPTAGAPLTTIADLPATASRANL